MSVKLEQQKEQWEVAMKEVRELPMVFTGEHEDSTHSLKQRFKKKGYPLIVTMTTN